MRWNTQIHSEEEIALSCPVQKHQWYKWFICDFITVSVVYLHMLQSILSILQGTEQSSMNGCCKTCKYELIKQIHITEYYIIVT